MPNNYTLGRGKVYFSRFKTGGQVPEGFAYIGNTPELSLTIEQETLDHFSSDEGVREKDDSVPLEVNRSGSMTTDNISPENVALFFFGQDSTVTQAAVSAAPETLTDVIAGHTYKLGITDARPAGHFGLNATGLTVVVGSDTMVGGTDYEMNLDAGTITFLEAGDVVTGDDVVVTYAVRAHSRSRVISGSEPVEGAMMYITQNPKGDDCVFFFPYIKVSPNGDYALKGDEWQTIPFTLEILKPTGKEAIYRDGDPAYT